MGAKVRGVSQAKSNLEKFISTVQGKKSARAVQSAIMIGSTRASYYTPIGDTSTLINSQARELIVNGARITGRFIYTANYAVYVHDPNIPMKFRRSTAQKEFLTKGFEEERSAIDAAVYKEMSL